MVDGIRWKLSLTVIGRHQFSPLLYPIMLNGSWLTYVKLPLYDVSHGWRPLSCSTQDASAPQFFRLLEGGSMLLLGDGLVHMSLLIILTWCDQSKSSRIDRHSSIRGLLIAHSLEAGKALDYIVGYHSTTSSVFRSFSHDSQSTLSVSSGCLSKLCFSRILFC